MVKLHIWISVLLMGITLCLCANAKPKRSQMILLDDEPVTVWWNDGDSFRVTGRTHKGLKARVVGFNTLESHGPVHQWGEWTYKDLARVSYRSTQLARQQRWVCKRVHNPDTRVATDHYGRVLVACPDLAASLVKAGLAHVLLFHPADADPALLEMQRKAQKEAKGMWKHGVPKQLMTSVHSADENREEGWKPYNRLVSTHSGLTRKVEHNNTYTECEEICMEGSCFIYVPFKRRYGASRAKCLYFD